MIKRLLLLVCAVFALVAPAHAALDGWDNKPGDPCTPAEEGHTRRNASADLDGSQITLICDGSQWQSAGGGLAALQGQDDTGPCTLEKDGLIRYRTSGDPHWEYCHGGTTSWLPFRLPQCQDDDAGACTLAALRSSNDPQFKASSIRCGDKLLGVTGTYGSGSSSAFTFTDVTNAALSTLTTASAVTISGIPAGCPAEVEVSGQGSPQVSVNGGAWGTSASIANGQTLAVRLTSSASFSTAHTATITIGSTEDSWSVTTLAADTTPNAFTFTDQTNVALSTLTTSNTITISGINTTTPVSVTGTGAQISINGGAWGTSGNITNGQTLAVRLTSSASFSTAMTATVNVGGVTDNWSVTTLPADTTPDAFTFTDQTNVALSTLITSNTITISGINTTTPVSVTGTGAQISINGGAWVTSGNITNGQTLAVRLTSSAAFSTAMTATVNVGGVTDNWSVTTLSADTTPNPFSFTDITNAELNSVITSNSVTISGINTAAPVSLTGGAQFRINGGSWVTSGNIANGQTLEIRLTSSADFSTAVNTNVTVGTLSQGWSVTTKSAVSYEFGSSVSGGNTLTATAVAGTTWGGSDNLAYLAIARSQTSSSRTFSNFRFDGVAPDWQEAAVDNGDAEHISTGMALLNVDPADTEKTIQYNMSGSANKQIAYIRILGGVDDVSVVYSSFIGNGPAWPYTYNIPNLQAGDIVVAALSYRTSSAGNAGSTATNMDAIWAVPANSNLDIYATVLSSDGTFSTTLNAPKKYQQWSQGLVVLRRN